MNADAVKAQTFRRRALEVRRIAEGIVDPACRRNLLSMAESYERLALAFEMKLAAQRKPVDHLH